MPIDHRPGRRSALYRLIAALKDVTADAVFVRSDPADGYVEEIAKETNSLYFDAAVDYREWMTVVRDAQFLLTGRYHNPILAAIMGCPSMTLGSSSHKVHGGCEMLEVIGRSLRRNRSHVADLLHSRSRTPLRSAPVRRQ